METRIGTIGSVDSVESDARVQLSGWSSVNDPTNIIDDTRIDTRLDPDTKRSSVIVAPSNATMSAKSCGNSARTRTSSSDVRGTSRECRYLLDPRLRILRTTSRGSTIASSDLFQPGHRVLLSRLLLCS